MRPHRRQPTRLPRPWDSPGKNTGVGCHFLLQCVKVKSESEVAQWCLTLSDPRDCSPPGSSIHGIFQARVLEGGAIAFSESFLLSVCKSHRLCLLVLICLMHLLQLIFRRMWWYACWLVMPRGWLASAYLKCTVSLGHPHNLFKKSGGTCNLAFPWHEDNL